MPPMRAFAFLLFVGLALAGCAEAPVQQGHEEASFDDVEVEDTKEGNGAILGVVVDQTIAPVAGVNVKLMLPGADPIVKTSDEIGRFAFGDVPPGVHILEASKDFYDPIQFTANVEPGVLKPEPVRVQITAHYVGDPFTVSIVQEGFFQCSQARMPPYLYSSSSCHDTNIVDGSDHGITLAQERDFHADVAEGWTTMVYEQTWKPSFAGSSERMGVVFSTYKPERNTNHWFANHEGDQPLRLEFKVGEIHSSAQEGSGPSGPIPADGMKDMSYFISVRPPSDAVCVIWCVPPGLALEQEFTTYLTQFYYGAPPEGWSLVNGDEDPF